MSRVAYVVLAVQSFSRFSEPEDRFSKFDFPMLVWPSFEYAAAGTVFPSSRFEAFGNFGMAQVTSSSSHSERSHLCRDPRECGCGALRLEWQAGEV